MAVLQEEQGNGGERNFGSSELVSHVATICRLKQTLTGRRKLGPL